MKKNTKKASTEAVITPENNSGNNMMLLNISRYLVGILFIFSGLIKANDPSGLAFKMQDFFGLWGMGGFKDYAMTFSILMITFEIIAGIALIIGYKFKTFSFLLLVLMLFFMFLTTYAVVYEARTGSELKCGCFGDCIPLTAWQSFWKDVILLALVVYLFLKRNLIESILPAKIEMYTMAGALIVVLLIQWIALNYLPYVDCLPFKKGRNMYALYKEAENAQDSVTTNFYYKIDGKTVKKTYEEYMADESLWEMEPEKMETFTVQKAPAYVNIMQSFQVVDENAQQYQEDIFKSPDAYFIFFVRGLDKVNDKNIEKVKKIYDDLNVDQKGGIITITSEPIGQVQKYLSDHGMPDMQVFSLDDVSIKIAIRSNPGLMLMQDGLILGKWTPSNYPSGFTFDANNKIQIK